MKANEMRKLLKTKTKYRNSKKWHERVEKMSESQIYAIYFRMLHSGEIF